VAVAAVLRINRSVYPFYLNRSHLPTSVLSLLNSPETMLGMLSVMGNRIESPLPVAVLAATTAVVAYAGYTYLTYDCRWWWHRRSTGRRQRREVIHGPNWQHTLIHGTVARGWERVRDEFIENFKSRGELGASVCVYYRGEKVVDLWGGYRDRSAQEPWEEDTLCPLFSTSKGISAFALALLISRGRLSLDERVVTYWPEFGCNGKADVTVRDILDHSCGLAGIDPPVTLDMLRDKIRTRNHIAAAKMEWPNPGDYKGYMAVMLGFYESAIVQLTEGSGRERTLGQYLHDEAFVPLGIDRELYIGLTDDVPDSRLAKLDAMSGLEPLWPTGAYPDGFMRRILLHPKSYTGRAFRNPRLSSMPSIADYDRREVKALEIPSAAAQGTARAVATLYRAAERAINTAGTDNPLGLSDEALALFTAPARPGRKNGWMDEILGIEACLGGGMLLPPPPNESLDDDGDADRRFVSVPSGFGTPGAGGSFAYCDPHAEVAYCYIPNRCGQFILDDPRDLALRDKMYETVQTIRETDGRNLPRLDIKRLTTAHYLTKRYTDMYPELKPLP